MEEMPIADYQCKNCGHKIEDKFFTSIAPKQIKCINCGSTANKMPSWANFVVNGFNEKNGYSDEK